MLGENVPLNKSNSKSITVGLTLRGQEFITVIQITGASSKPISFDKPSWMEFNHHFDVIDAYFGDTVTYAQMGSPVKIYGRGFDLSFTTSYSKKALLLEERPLMSDGAPMAKRRRTSAPPTNIMQETTFEGIRRIADSVLTKIDLLEYIKLECSKILEAMINYFDEIRLQQRPEMFKDIFLFRKLCYERMEEIEGFIGVYDDTPSILEYLNRLLTREMLSFEVNSLLNILKESYANSTLDHEEILKEKSLEENSPDENTPEDIEKN